MKVELNWTLLDDLHHLWDEQLCLYAYCHPETGQPLYIGKADYTTVKERLYGKHKNEIVEWIADTFDIEEFDVLHGEFVLNPGQRRSSEFLTDIESLLIFRLQPPANIQSRSTHWVARRGMVVGCLGDWPMTRDRFRDI